MIETARLRLRGWEDADEAPFAAATNTPAVMAYLGGVQPPAHFAGLAATQRALVAAHGTCFWLMEDRVDGRLLGFCGLEPVDLPGTPLHGDVEIGWRLRADAWGRGYAREAATAVLDRGWRTTAAARVVAMTVPANRASRGLMRRLAMTERPDLRFDHPAFPAGHPLSAHCVYVIGRP